MTAALAFMWLASSSAWAKGLSDVKWATSPTTVTSQLNFCAAVNKCSPGATPHMGRLNASVVSCPSGKSFSDVVKRVCTTTASDI